MRDFIERIIIMLLAYLAIGAGLIALMWSADALIAGVTSLARHWGVSSLIIGLTVVAFGTSAPEMVVSLIASLEQASAMAVGNVIGSNIANISLVFGLTICISPVAIKRGMFSLEFGVLLLVTLITGLVLFDHQISITDSLLFGLCLIGFVALLTYKARHNRKQAEIFENEANACVRLPIPRSYFQSAFSLTVLLVSADTLVWGAKTVALDWGISELIVGLTVVAIGTSLPELATCIASARKGHSDLAIGNIIGSNVLNILLVLSLPGIVDSQATLPTEAFYRDYFTMLAMTVIWIGLFSLCIKQKRPMGRISGTILLLSFLTYYYGLYAYA